MKWLQDLYNCYDEEGEVEHINGSTCLHVTYVLELFKGQVNYGFCFTPEVHESCDL